MTTTPFKLLIAACGFSLDEAATYLKVRRDSVVSWASGKNETPAGVMDELRACYTMIGLRADEMLREHEKQGAGKPFQIKLPKNDAAARKMGWPCVGAAYAAAGMIVTMIDVPMEIEEVDAAHS